MPRIAAVLMLILLPSAAAAAPKVVATIKPVHSLVAAVMDGRGAPVLLLPDGASPHLYALRPSDAKRLAAADIVFWVGPELERFLADALAGLAPRARRVALAEARGVVRLPVRADAAWSGPAEEHGHAADEAGTDPHVWLDPLNARHMAGAIVAALKAVDPAGADLYARNGRSLAARLDALDARLRERLAPVRDIPFIVMHDAYQYFERRYGLAALGAVTLSPEIPPGAKRIVALRRAMRDQKAVCLFREPQATASLAETLTAGTSVHTAVLDPLGNGLTPGPDAYFTLIETLAEALRGCLATGS